MSAQTVVKLGGSLCADPMRLRALLASIAEGAFGACLVVPGGGAFADAVRLDQARLGFDDAQAHRRALDAMGRMAAHFHAIEPRVVPSPLYGLLDSDTSSHDRMMRGFSSPRRHLVVPAGSERRSPNGGEGVVPEEPDPSTPPHLRLPPRRADDAVAAALSPHAGRGDVRRSNGQGRTTCESGSLRREGRDEAGDPRTPVWDPAALRAGHPDIPETWDVTSDSLALWAATQLRAGRCVLVKSADAPAGADARDLARLGLVDAAFPAFAARYGGRIAILGPGGERPVHARAAA